MSIYDEIRKEREYQDGRWGHQVDDEKNTPWMWVAYIVKYAASWQVGTFAPLGKSTIDVFRTCMIKTAAICVAAVESLDRQRAEHGKAFFE